VFQVRKHVDPDERLYTAATVGGVMLPAGSRELRPVVVGAERLADTITGRETEHGRDLDAEAVDPEAVRNGGLDGRPDCVVVDGEELGSDCVDVVAECAEGESPPVLLLLDGTREVAADALAAGATETLPRRLVEDDPEIFADQLGATVERERARRGFGEVFENVSDGLVVHDPETGELLDVNGRYCELMGYDREELVGKTVADLIPEDADYTESDAYERMERAREEGPQLFEVQARRKDGTSFVGEIHLSVVELRGEERMLASVRDVTERRRRERMVESLHGATERLQDAETTEAACRTTVEAARDVLGLPLTACWLYREDEDGPRLEPVAATEPVEEIDPGPFRPGDVEYEAFREGELLVYDPSEHFPENPLDAAIMLPLGEHGLLAAGKPGVSEYDEFVVDAARTLAGHVRTALDRVARAQRLRESERRLSAILDRIDEAIFLAPASELNDSDPAADYVSAGYEGVYGLSLAEMHEQFEEGFFGHLHPDEYDAYWSFVDDIRGDVEAGEAADRYSREYRIEPPDVEVRWVHSDYYPTEWEGECKIVVVSRDVTDRKERERTLESFHGATAELTTADTVDAVGEVAVRAAADVFELPATAVYSYDEESGVLEPAAAGPGVEGDLAPMDAEEGPAWAAFAEERMRRVPVAEAPALDAGPDDEPLVVPLGGNGLLAVWHSGEELDPDAANIMAATVEAALNRLRGERRLASRSEELEAQVERARRLEAVTELTQRVEAAITAESSRRGVQRAVCEELTDVAPFEAAWIAEADVGTDRLTPRAVAGIDRDRAEASLDAHTDADPHPAYGAWESGEPTVVEDLVGGRRSGWRRSLLARGAGSVCALALSYGGVTHGVLTIVADEPGAFGEREREVLDQLGTSIGYAITAIERQRALESDNTVELGFRGAEADIPPARLARELDCRVCHERTVRRQDGSVGVYYTLAGDLPADVAAAADGTLPGTVETVTRDDGEVVIERRGSSWFGSVVSEYGGVLRRGEATPSEVTLLVELPQEADTRTIVGRLGEAFPGLELTAQRQHRETATTPGEVATQLEGRLTDRQQEALETAHAMGYFDWPRESSGEDVAGALDITQPTVNKHIRLGEREVFDLLFGSD
jgi:PAS domain S-box-containing protein